MKDPKELGIISIEQLYIVALAKAFEGEQYQTALQDHGDGKSGRLWLMRAGSTVPEAHVDFNFVQEGVSFAMTTRSERKLDPVVVKFAEGVEGYLERAVKLLRAGLLASKVKAA